MSCKYFLSQCEQLNFSKIFSGVSVYYLIACLLCNIYLLLKLLTKLLWFQMPVPGYPPPGYPTQGYAMPYPAYGQHPGYHTSQMVNYWTKPLNFLMLCDFLKTLQIEMV